MSKHPYRRRCRRLQCELDAERRERERVRQVLVRLAGLCEDACVDAALLAIERRLSLEDSRG